MEQCLKYLGVSIVCAEVPDEIALAINISGCPHRCNGCHSQYLWEYKGNNISDDLEDIIYHLKEYITCVCFMGGDQNMKELGGLLREVKDSGLKTCLYSGLDDIKPFSSFIDSGLLDYIKIGSYKSELGSLGEPSTNQRMYEVSDGKLTDITYKFSKEYRLTMCE